ncbi:AAA family ATPase [Candidatus Pacearchaeota archaeon RBG_13_36_9]|nr:MAG: AAA family ATPase [Candidatus Pacearchaeota archaeon RBG_13_36_9]
MYIERDVRGKFEKLNKIYPVLAIVGARQSGKTTFLKEQLKKLKASYLLFDDPDIRDLFEQDIKKFEKQYIEGYQTSVLDEVHYCKDAGRKIKYLADTGRKLWITSSSEILLSKEVLSFLVGRVSIIRLYPFSIKEFLDAKNQKAFTGKVLERNIWEHMTYGGYPKVVTTEDFELKKSILKDLYETMILKDIARTFSIADLRSLEEFTRYLSLNISGIISYDSISRDIKISFQTLKKYLNAMEKSYLIARVQPFFNNKTKEITKQPRVYFIDTGLRNIISKNFGQEPEGKLFENYVFCELVKLGFSPKYWRTKTGVEVDFIIEKDKEVIPIEVKLTAPDRLERNLAAFIESYKPKKALIISYKGENKKVTQGNCEVIFTDVLEMSKFLE